MLRYVHGRRTVLSGPAVQRMLTDGSQVLDQYFGNVCELDLVFNFHKVFVILDEYILAGEIMETSKTQIINRIHTIDRLLEGGLGRGEAGHLS